MTIDLPTPRYRIGDITYFPTVKQTTERLPCPDCLGTEVWKLTTPGGTECEISCPRCHGGYSPISGDLPSLNVTRYTPSVRAVTIRYIEVCSDSRYGHEDRVRYMESDTGSGSVYNERQLCATYDTAMDVARLQCAEHNAKLDALPSTIEARKFSSVTFDAAHVRRAQDAVYRAWRGFRNLRDRIEELLPEDQANDDKLTLSAGEVREAIETAVRYADQHPDLWADDLDRFLTTMDKGSSEQQLEAAHELGRVLLL